MSAPEGQLSESWNSAIEEFLTALKSESKLVRRNALEKFHFETFEEPLDANVQLDLVYAATSPQLLRALSDASEACRTSAILIVSSFVKRINMNDYQLTYIMPVLVRRVGRPEIVEESEELRLSFVALVHTIIERNESQTLEPFINDFTGILCKTITDPYPEVRIETAACITLLAPKLRRAFHMQAESYIKPILPSLSHQRFKVRVAAVESIGAIVMYGSAKCLEQCVTPLAEKLFDEVQAVRARVTREVGRWMLSHNDRYSYWHRMLPIILTGLSDSSEEIRLEAEDLWTKIGLQFMEENEQDLMKITDFMENNPVVDYPNVTRPNLGCRTLVERNIGKILPAIARECEGWQADARLRVMQLLRWLLLCAESGATQHAPAVVAILRRAARDADRRVVYQMLAAAEYFGIFIAPETWWPLLKPTMDASSFFVLARIAVGTKHKFLRNDSVILKEIMKEISSPEQCHTSSKRDQEGLLSLASSVVDVLRENAMVVKDELFSVIFTVYAMSDADIEERAMSILRDLCQKVYECNDMQWLYAQQMERTLAPVLASEPAAWNLVSPHFCLMYAVMENFGTALGENISVLTRALRHAFTEPNLEPRVKVKLFNALSIMLSKKHMYLRCDDQNSLLEFCRCIREDVIMPHLVWRPGLTAESVRCAAVNCLCCLLQAEPASDGGGTCSGDSGDSVMRIIGREMGRATAEMMPTVSALLDDRSHWTRQRALLAVMSCVKLAHENSCFTAEHLHKIYPAVLRCLDDGCEDVRSSAAHVLVILFCSRPQDYDTTLYNAHIEAVYSTMLVHLDDPDPAVGSRMLGSLKELSGVDPELLLKKVKANAPLYRNKEAFETLQDTLSKLSVHQTEQHTHSDNILGG